MDRDCGTVHATPCNLHNISLLAVTQLSSKLTACREKNWYMLSHKRSMLQEA